MKKIVKTAILFSSLFFSFLLEAAPFGYVTNNQSNTVSVIDLKTNQIVKNIPVGQFHVGVVLSENQKFVYVANFSSYSISVIKTSSNEVVKSITVPLNPLFLALSPDQQQLWVPGHQNPGYVYVINLADDTYQTISGFADPSAIAFTPDGKKVYVGQSNSINILNVENFAIEAVVPLESAFPFSIALNTKGSAYVTLSSGQVGYVDPDTTVFQLIPYSGADPEFIAITPDNKYAYVTDNGNQVGPYYVSRIDLATNLVDAGFIEVGNAPVGIAISVDGQYAYVCNSTSDSISVIDLKTNTVCATITGSGSGGFGFPVLIALPTRQFTVQEGMLWFNPVNYQGGF